MPRSFECEACACFEGLSVDAMKLSVSMVGGDADGIDRVYFEYQKMLKMRRNCSALLSRRKSVFFCRTRFLHITLVSQLKLKHGQ